MKLIFHKDFVKAASKLDYKLQNKVDAAMEIFKIDPNDRILKNHALKGDLWGRRAIKVTGDVRIIFQQFNDYVLVILLDVGTHNQVY